MLTPHFRADGWDGPDGFLKVELAPFRQPQLAGPGEDQRKQFQGGDSFGLAVEGFNSAKERAEGGGISDRRTMLDLRRPEHAPEGND
jgi:hypothetical protein